MRSFIVLSLFALTLVAGPAAAESTPKEKTRVQFVDMEVMLLEGRLVRPKGLHIDAKKKVHFDQLFELSRPVLPRLAQTARDAALR